MARLWRNRNFPAYYSAFEEHAGPEALAVQGLRGSAEKLEQS
jgi:hypothetical protein